MATRHGRVAGIGNPYYWKLAYMLKVFNRWYHEIFADEEALILLLLITVILVLMMTLGNVLAPFVASAIFAFLLEGLVASLQRWGLPRWVALCLTYVLFVGGFLVMLVFVMPLAWRQMLALFNEFPGMVAVVQQSLIGLQQTFSGIISEKQLAQWTTMASEEFTRMGQKVLTVSVSQLPNIVGIMVYVVLVPILVFFMLLDKDKILGWMAAFLPAERPLMRKVWVEMNNQVANYARGKAIEILLVGVVTYVAFSIMGLGYAALLSLLVGLSVLIPYIGAAVVTIPVALVGFFQWGWTNDFFYLIIVYGIIQALDGNVLVPLLFSEAVNLHPIAIILGVLVFGGLWGLWGVFFAIPLTTLIKALLQSWPRKAIPEAETITE
jgi:putative permease